MIRRLIQRMRCNHEWREVQKGNAEYSIWRCLRCNAIDGMDEIQEVR